MNTLMLALARPIRLRSEAGAEPGRKVTWLELFFDLVFVAAVSQVGAPLGVDYSLPSLGRFAVLFVLIWWAWYGHTIYATRFDTDDVAHRALTLLQMFAVAAMAVNAKDALGSRDSAGFAAAYAVMRLLLVAQLARARRVPAAGAFARAYATGFGTAAALWLASAVTPPPVRFYLWALALAIDLATPLLTSRHTVAAPPDAAHLPERIGLFTIILLGDAMVGVMRGMESQATWTTDAALSAFLGMVVVFLMWWAYFNGASAAEERHIHDARDVRRLHAWTYAHLPLYVGIVVVGVGIHHTIAVATVGHLHAAEAWILCGSLALVMATLATMAPARRMACYIPAALTLALAGVAPFLPCAVVVAALVLLLVVQIRLVNKA